MATLQEISEAIQSVEGKKLNLKEAFEDLQKHSHYLASFSLSWPEIDSHFSQIQSSLQTRLSLLQQKEQSLPKSKLSPETLIPEKSQNPEIRAICEKMEAINLRNWVKDNCKLKGENLEELGQGLKCAPDPFKLVLDAIERVYPKGKSCVLLLEALMMVEGVNVSEDVRERAKSLGLESKSKLNKEGKNFLEVLGVLNLLVSFRLVEEFGKDDVIGLVYVVASSARAAKLCRVLGLEEKVPDLIQKLVKDGRQPQAIKFVCEFKLMDKFQPKQLLKSYLKRAKKEAEKLRKKGKNSSQALGLGDEKELNALKTVLKYIGDYNLTSEYPPEIIEKRIKRLEELKANRKIPAPIRLLKPTNPKQKLPNQNLKARSKQPVAHTSSVPAAQPGNPTIIDVSSLPPSRQSCLQHPAMLAKQPILGSSVGPYAVLGSRPNVSYPDSSNLLYGSSSLHMGYASSPGSQIHVLESQLPSSSYNRPRSLAGYGIPPEHYPSYHRR